jgi:hypothetical protein
MKKKWKIIVAVLIVLPLFAGATCVKAVANVFTDGLKGPDYSPCPSAEEAKRRGTWVCDVEVTPARFTWQGHNIAFLEMWEEEIAAPAHFLVWFPCYRRFGGKYMCFRLAEGQEVFIGEGGKHGPWFQLESDRGSFGMGSINGLPLPFSHQSAASCSFPNKMGIAPAPQKPVEAYDITLTAKPKAGWFR